MADAEPRKLPPVVWPSRHTIVRLDPNLADSPLRRALYDAHLHAPFRPTDNGPTAQETRTP